MTDNTTLGRFYLQQDAAECPLYGYSVKVARDPKDLPDAADHVEIEIAFSDTSVDGRVFDAVRKARRNGSYAPVSFSGYYGPNFFHGSATISRFDDPVRHGHGYVARLAMTTQWLHWDGPLANDMPPIVQPEPEERIETAPVEGRLLTCVSPASVAGLASFEAARDEHTGMVTVTAQVTRSRTAFAGIRNFFLAWPNKPWATVEGDWKGNRFDMKNARCIECGEDGRIVLTVSAESFKGPGLLVGQASAA